MDHLEQTITIGCIAGLAAFALFVDPSIGKEITIAAVSGLVGYLSKNTK